MKPHAHELVIGDRISTREELGEVIVLLVKLRQLPFEATLESLQSESRSEAEELGLWTDADGERWSEAETEPLTNIILGRRLRLN
jgi:hypothetical protein